MNTRNTNNQRYKEAGEQAGRVINDFISIADELARRFADEIPATQKPAQKSARHNAGVADPEYSNADSSSGSAANDQEPEWQRAGEYLRELREAAGYTVDGFATAINRPGAARKMKTVEQGLETLPAEWLDQISALLKQQDPQAFTNKLCELYDVDEQDSVKTDSTDKTATADTTPAGGLLLAKRRYALAELFDGERLEKLSDSEFERLLEFTRSSSDAALRLMENDQTS